MNSTPLPPGAAPRLAAVADRLRALRGWRRLAVAAAFGAASAFALSPFYVLPLLFAYAALVWLLDGAEGPRAAFATGWAFAFGQFVIGLHWTGFAFLVDAEKFAALLPAPILGLPGGLGLIFGLATMALWYCRPGGAGRVLGLALAWTAGEYARGHLLTGFPWNLPGYAWVATDASMQAAAWLGVYGLTLLTVAVAAAPALLERRGTWRWPAGLLILCALLAAAGWWRLADATADMQPGVRLRLVQAAVNQYEKWQEDKRSQHVGEHMELSLGPATLPVTHVVWPESAIPFFIEHDPNGRAWLARAVPPGGLLISGVPRRTPPGAPELKVWNSLLAIDETGAVRAAYDKHHLVPFGEYLPLRPVLSAIGLERLVPGSIDYSPGDIVAPVALPGLPKARILICYEAIFPAEAASEERPGWLLNVTNDGWFGQSIGPHQHLAMARLRAVEQGLPLVRAANTGISAIVDAHGRIVASLGLGRRGVVDGPLPVAIAAPPYARLGDAAIIPLVAIALFLTWRTRRHR